MIRHIMWTPANQPGFEHLKLTKLAHRVTASGLIIGLDGQTPYRVRYEIGCDAKWQVRRLDIEQLDVSTEHGLFFVSDGHGSWATADGEPLPNLDGCLDVDIQATPFTNTIPIERLQLKNGQSAVLKVLYISVPAMEYKVVEQTYTCVTNTLAGGTYRYHSISAGKEVEVTTDRDGLIVNFPDRFRQITFDGGH